MALRESRSLLPCFGLADILRLRRTFIEQCTPRLVLLHRLRLSRKTLPHSVLLQGERSQIHHQRTFQVQVQAEALNQNRPSGGRLQPPQRVAHLISPTERALIKRSFLQKQVLRLILCRKVISLALYSLEYTGQSVCRMQVSASHKSMSPCIRMTIASLMRWLCSTGNFEASFGGGMID